MSEVGRQYDSFVRCAVCGGRRPLEACKWVHFPKPIDGQAGEYQCRDEKYCATLKAEIWKLREGV